MNRPVKTLIMALILLTGIAASVGFGLHRAGTLNPDTVMKISGSRVVTEEYKMLMERQKPDVYAYYQTLHQVEPGDLRWGQAYEGEVPADMLMELTQEKLLQNRFVFYRAKQQGILKDDSFDAFVHVWETEKEKRQTGVEDSSIVYGPVDIEMYEYYDYYLEELKGNIKESLWNANRPTDQQLEQYMLEHKENYIKPKRVEAIRLYVETREEGQAREALKKCYEILSAGGSVEEALQHGEGLVMLEEIRMDEESYHYDSKVYPMLREQAMKLQTGSCTSVTENAGTCDIAVVTKTEDSGYYTLDEVYPAVKHEWVEMLYQEVYRQWIETSEIEVNRDLQRQILEEYL